MSHGTQLPEACLFATLVTKYHILLAVICCDANHVTDARKLLFGVPGHDMFPLDPQFDPDKTGPNMSKYVQIQ